MTQSFDNPKELKFVITLGTGNFGSSNNNQITLQGFRARARIDKAGGMMMGTLRAQIYGVSQSNMNSCVTFPYQPQKLAQQAEVKMNTVQVSAIDGDSETLIFTGNIVNAWGNYQNMPDVFLEIQAMSTAVSLLAPAIPTSFDGPIDVVTAIQQLAGKMNLTFENNGVSGISLVNQYLSGTYIEQVQTLAKAARIWMYIDNEILAISPSNQPRTTISVPLISPQTGLKGYPTFDSIGINIVSLFNPAIRFGGSIQVQSSIPQANGKFIATNIGYDLDSLAPNGQWFMQIRGTKSGLAIGSGRAS